MKASIDFPTSLRLSAEDAQDVLLAETLERSETESGHWNAEESLTASRNARELAGTSATPAVYLPIRARLVLARLKTFVPNQEKLCNITFNTWPLVLGLLLLAYLGGALTDSFATEGARINLLSPPVLLLLMWNLIVYLLLLLSALGLSTKARFSPIEMLAIGFSRMKWTGLDKNAPKALFAVRWTAVQTTRLRTEASRAFHLASCAFAIGLLTSIAVRGIGTAYIVGWESTWFDENPEWIAAILRTVYDIIPLDWFGGTPWPDYEIVADLRFDRIDSATFNSASDWLCRLMLTISAVILLPRILLIAVSSWKLSRLKKAVTIDTTTSYYRSIFSTDKLPEKHSILIVDHADDSVCLPTEWLSLKSRLQTNNLLVTNAWEGDISEKIASLPEATVYDCLIGLDPTGTPEEEVHGHLIDCVKGFCLHHSSPSPIVILNLAPLVKRHGSDSDKVGSRRALWESFAHQHGVSSIAVNLSDEAALTTVETRLSTLTNSLGQTKS